MADQQDSLIGQQLGNYRIISLLGQGGFADVYLGEHVHLRTQAAIKVLRTRLGKSDRESFLREAQTIARLDHANIVRVWDFGVENETPYLVMSHAVNGSLRQRHHKGARLAPGTILPYVTQVASALQYAHNQRLIHRDVKPENMLLGKNNEVLLSDFGIALVAQSSRYQSTQDIVGTAVYMAPEQLQGRPSPASDQYSLAITVYEWLAGERPFQGSYVEILGQHMTASPGSLCERNPAVSPAIEQAVFIALAKNPQDRFSTIEAFARALGHAVAELDGTTIAKPTNPLMPGQSSLLGAPNPSSTFIKPTGPGMSGYNTTEGNSSTFIRPSQPGMPAQNPLPGPALPPAQPGLPGNPTLTGGTATQSQSWSTAPWTGGSPSNLPSAPSGSTSSSPNFPTLSGGTFAPNQPWSAQANTPAPGNFASSSAMQSGTYGSPQGAPPTPPGPKRSSSARVKVLSIVVLVVVLVAGSFWGVTALFHAKNTPSSSASSTGQSGSAQTASTATTVAGTGTPSSDNGQTPANGTTPDANGGGQASSLTTTSPTLPLTIRCVECGYPDLALVLTSITANAAANTTLWSFTITNNGASQCSQLRFYQLELEGPDGTQYQSSGQASDSWSLNAGTSTNESPTLSLVPRAGTIYTLNVQLDGSCNNNGANTYQTENFQFAPGALTGNGGGTSSTSVVPKSPKLPLTIACVQCGYPKLSLVLTRIDTDASGSTTMWSFTITNNGSNACSRVQFYQFQLEDPSGTQYQSSGQARDAWSLNANTSVVESPALAFTPQPNITYTLNIQLDGSCNNNGANTYQTENLQF